MAFDSRDFFRIVRPLHRLNLVLVLIYFPCSNSKEVETLCPRKQTVSAPVFNLVDDGNTTLGDVAKVQSKVFDVKVSFTNVSPFQVYL